MTRRLFVAWMMMVACVLTAPLRAAEQKKEIDWLEGGGKSEAATKPAESGLPRVLIIGDSISIGYTKPVTDLLKGKAQVVRPPTNCQFSAFGVKNVKAWLGTGGSDKWDVIHFNFGIWDTHYLDNTTGGLVRDESKVDVEKVHIRTSPEEYRENLKKIVAMLKATGAKVIWASTTPVMHRKGARFEDIVKLNAVAAEVMKENGIEVNDLYSAALSHAETWIGGDHVHMTPEGNKGLAQLVADKVTAALPAAK